VNGSELIRRLIEAIAARDISGYGALYAEDAVLEEPLFGEPLRGRASIAESEAALFAAFSEIEIRIVATFGDGRRAAAELVLAATNTGPLDLGVGESVPATRRRIEVPMAIFIEAGPNGLVARERDYFDTATVLRQLGLADE
jgi:steroid delta-isomerase-like uncharacterized protein